MEPQENKGLRFPQVNPAHNLLTHSSITTNLNIQAPELANHSPSHAYLPQNPDFGSIYFSRFLSNSKIHVPVHSLSPSIPSLSTDSSLDEAREHQLSIMDEKRLRRIISNRESARRSRMRKKKQIEELHWQVNQLQTMNHQLSEKVIHLLESNHQILQENAQLKEKVASLQLVFTDLLTPLRNVEESTCNTGRLKAEATDRSTHH